MIWDGSRWILDDDSRTISSPSAMDYIVTGIPRSGTSLVSAILSSSSNSVCFNEIHYDIPTLPAFFTEMRYRISSHQSVVMMLDEGGTTTTDTQKGDEVSKTNSLIVDKEQDIHLGSKVNIPYLDKIQSIQSMNYKIIAMVRDPVFNIASWNSNEVDGIPESRVDGDEQHPRWNKFSFTNESRLERQVMIWDNYAEIIDSLSDEHLVVRYEYLISNPSRVISELCDFLDINKPAAIPELIDGNDEKKYPHLEEIIDVVNQNSKMKQLFGY
jgi:hypothetical protein